MSEERGETILRVLTVRQLQAMQRRWERDLETLQSAIRVDSWEADTPGIETIRNLNTAIAQINGIMTGTTYRALSPSLESPQP